MLATGRREMGGPDREELQGLLDDLRAYGMPEAEVEKARKEAEQRWSLAHTHLDVHPDNVIAVRLFMAMTTQWRTEALSTMDRAQVIKTGLDYGVLEPTARLAGLGEVAPADFSRLRTLEIEAMACWRAERERRQ